MWDAHSDLTHCTTVLIPLKHTERCGGAGQSERDTCVLGIIDAKLLQEVRFQKFLPPL